MVWSTYAQTHVVAAQYFRNPDNLDLYLNRSNFLADINNERPHRNDSYATHLKDWLGLQSLGSKGKIDYLEIDGVHMQIPESQLRAVARAYLGTIDYPYLFQHQGSSH
ncbi:hypothetical protein AWJ20_4245 [Sugiyamaella lignohabitans]|uniref:Uncharacterized protein n=1 Tax=Sugiyamaella lignohabitans TaxID=796027 RepID=A0A167CAN0_9ASCO|nr:uncharacterized protein AWJ20_4245 [Sugiyamaella lignohabitans]ANB11435.1 hypothetical protein AWJ20_4245 [Sugiyamaella lignohabitans]